MSSHRLSMNVKCSDIVAYWHDKYVHRDGLITSCESDDGIPVIGTDILLESGYLPHCFLCGVPFYLEACSNDDLRALFERNDDWQKAWNHTHLDRAHILADCRGGMPTVDNLLCLCRSCHTHTESLSDNYSLYMADIYSIKSYVSQVGVTPWLYDTVWDQVQELVRSGCISKDACDRLFAAIDLKRVFIAIAFFNGSALHEEFHHEELDHSISQMIISHNCLYR